MSAEANTARERVSRVARSFPVDLALVLVLVWGLTASDLLAGDRSLLRFLAGAVLLFFGTGYVLVAVLFPARPLRRGAESVADGAVTGRSLGLSLGERVLLSVGTSVVLVPLFAFAIEILGGGYTPQTVSGVLSVFALVGSVLAVVRRQRVPMERRFVVPIGRWARAGWRSVFEQDGIGRVVNVVLALSVLAGLGAGAYALAVPQPGAQYTDFALLTETATGEYVSADYPTNLTQGESEELVVSVENHRRSRTDYTIVAELQQVRTDGDRLTVLSQNELRRLSTTLGPNQTWYRPHRIRPRQAGTDLRLAYYLYRGEAPTDATAATADRHLQLWVNVSTRV